MKLTIKYRIHRRLAMIVESIPLWLYRILPDKLQTWCILFVDDYYCRNVHRKTRPRQVDPTRIRRITHKE